MPIESVPRRWTIATWLVAGSRDDVEAIAAPLIDGELDVVMLQSIGKRNVDALAAAIGANHVWALSHHRRSRLLPGSGVGLAALTPHRIIGTVDAVVGEHRSRWSKHRRIAQEVTVERADHSAYAISHSVADGTVTGPAGPPRIVVRPSLVDAGAERAVELPDGAVLVDVDATTPIAGAAPLLTVTFEMAWVQGDFG
ncbi:MAG: hypothetical protein QNJ12_18975 [Ilumatobacter sp.]|uniref:hypothetical protein n=1 Tax=Ilumatobacter sp. TaxID=1967498 RepID=UPI00262314CC|nr:hypothetical protein [Ilumatobacter sp.]MDJ0770884.1 hypothetical protein [Ilumatobacter sp.]